MGVLSAFGMVSLALKPNTKKTMNKMKQRWGFMIAAMAIIGFTYWIGIPLGGLVSVGLLYRRMLGVESNLATLFDEDENEGDDEVEGEGIETFPVFTTACLGMWVLLYFLLPHIVEAASANVIIQLLLGVVVPLIGILAGALIYILIFIGMTWQVRNS